MNDSSASDDADRSVIEVHVPELRTFFDVIDPSPFNDRDLDPGAERFIVGWAKELPRNAKLALLVHLDRPAGPPGEAAALADAVREFFIRRTTMYRRQLRELFERGRISLAIGLVFVTAAIAIGDAIATRVAGGVGEIVRESLSIGGWVAMWRPLEIFLYDWWPIRAEANLSKRLAAMPVTIRYAEKGTSDSWRHDWPATARPVDA